jgi:hypothetical protein
VELSALVVHENRSRPLEREVDAFRVIRHFDRHYEVDTARTLLEQAGIEGSCLANSEDREGEVIILDLLIQADDLSSPVQQSYDGQQR